MNFTVGLSNQNVLGFFNPKFGDQIVVTGNFCDWDGNGFQMKKLKEFVYNVSINAYINTDTPLEYKFRILKGIDRPANFLFPNNGWESIPNRRFSSYKDTTNINFSEFNDISRVARFIIDAKNLVNRHEFNPSAGDILQVGLSFNNAQPILSDKMIEVDNCKFEIALTIPLTVQTFKWQIIKNILWLFFLL